MTLVCKSKKMCIHIFSKMYCSALSMENVYDKENGLRKIKPSAAAYILGKFWELSLQVNKHFCYRR